MDIKRSLDNDAPVLILYQDPDEVEAPLEEVSDLAAAFGVPLALITDLEDSDKLVSWLSETACFVINKNRENLLSDTVNRLVRNSENERTYARRQQYLEELEHRYNLLLDSSRDAIAYVHEGLHVYANRAYLTALHLEDESDTAALSLLELIKPKDENTNMKTLLKGLSKGEFPGQALSVSVRRPDGSEFDAALVFSAARFDGEDCTQMMMQLTDSASELASELERMRALDPVTGMLNRKTFHTALDECIAGDAHDAVAAVLYLETDNFDQLLEEMPGDASDELLADFARLVEKCIGPEDTVGRITDHGLAILAHRTSMADLEAMAQNILATYRSHIVEIGDHALSASASIGLANIGRLATDADEILGHARKAHHDAAVDGDRFEVFRPQLTAVENVEGDEGWLDRIKFALGNQDLYTVQQSIVDLDGEGDQIMENITFLRGEGGDHSSVEFMRVAERHDLAGNIDRHVLPGLMKTFVDQPQRQIINLSSNSVLDYAFPGWFAEQMKAACIEGSKLIVQISTQTALSNLRPAQRLLKELQPLGCKLSVCHFEAERRTLQLLEHLDASYVKLDAALTVDLISNTRQQDDIRKIVEVAEKSGVIVIADEVADTSSLAVLWQCGVKLIAGAFLSESSQILAQ
jgi:diguanylate cyclase (GGDEF)-like protein